MEAKSKPKPLTDAECHKRFVAMARQVDASGDSKVFDKAFNKVTAKPASAKASR
jgi:hypothetical protein